MELDEYFDLQKTAFVQYYRCLPTSRVNRGNIDEDGNKVVMPPSALDRLSSLEIEFPMQFRIQNPSTGRVSHVGVLEFVAEEGFIHVPAWLMARLGLGDNDLVLVQQKALPKATFVKLQPHTSDFTVVSNPRELLEYNFSKYACLTAGETITVTEGDRRYRLDVVEARPADAVSVIETDCEVDFATPLDYVEPPPPAPALAKPAKGQVVDNDDGPVRFPGVAARLDGKPVEQPTTKPQSTPAAESAGAAASQPKRGLRFGAASAAGCGCAGVSKGKEEEGGGKDQVQRFTGTAYKLK